MTKSRRKIIFILGLSRVGSTMLDLILGSHPKFVGLGEIFQVLRPDMNRFDRKEYCSCGEVIDKCPFWGPAAEVLRKNRSADLQERYRRVFKVFDSVFSSDNIIVDSSKLLSVLKIIGRLPAVDVKVIYLIRDVRAWTISRLNHRDKNPDYYSQQGNYVKRIVGQFGWKAQAFRWVFPLATKMPVYHFWLWYWQNKQMQNFLDAHRVEHFQLGYDELGLNPDQMMTAVFDFLGIGDVNLDFSSLNSKSHVLIGNTQKTESKRRQGIFYDHRWLYRNDWLLPAAIFPNIMNYNAKEVYKNIKANSIWNG